MLTDVEAELLLICARQSLPDSLVSRAIEILDESPLRWPYLTQEASRHGVAPLLFKHFESLGDRVGVEQRNEFRQAYVKSAFRARVHEDALAVVVSRMVEAGVVPVLLKGMSLTRTVYPDAALRPFADIDLLIATDKIDIAKAVLISCGYSLAPELWSEKFNRQYHMNLPFARKAHSPVHIELHWKLTDHFSLVRFDEQAMLARTRSVAVGNAAANVLDPADELVYLAAHVDNHGYLNRAMLDGCDKRFLLHALSGNRLIWFTDLHELVCRSVDWNLVCARARHAHADAPLAISLQLTRALLGTPIDTTLLSDLPKADWLRRKISRHVRSLANAGDEHLSAANFNRLFLSTRKGFELRLIRLIDIWTYIFPPPELAQRAYAMHVLRAISGCLVMLVQLVFYRASRQFRTHDAV